ncbi:hypothetical protein ACN28S_18255 [Cystobacter fuscus]
MMLLDALMLMRRDLHEGRIAMHIGSADANVLAGFMAGYRACLGDNGVDDAEATEFLEWLGFEKEEFLRRAGLRSTCVTATETIWQRSRNSLVL